MKPKILIAGCCFVGGENFRKIFWAMFVLGLGFIEFNGVLKLEIARIFVLLFLVE